MINVLSRITLALLVTNYLTACALLTGSEKADVNAVYEIQWVYLKAPKGTDWYIVDHNELGIYFEKAAGSTAGNWLAKVLVYQVRGYENDRDFINYIIAERQKSHDESEFLEVKNSNQFVTLKNQGCFRYETLAKDDGERILLDSDPRYFRATGIICRHSINSSIAVHVELAYRSTSMDKPPYFDALARRFEKDIKFVDNDYDELE